MKLDFLIGNKGELEGFWCAFAQSHGCPNLHTL
jgi:hypothetical protein